MFEPPWHADRTLGEIRIGVDIKDNDNQDLDVGNQTIMPLRISFVQVIEMINALRVFLCVVICHKVAKLRHLPNSCSHGEENTHERETPSL